VVDIELKIIQNFIGNHPPEGGIIGGDILHLADGILNFFKRQKTHPHRQLSLCQSNIEEPSRECDGLIKFDIYFGPTVRRIIISGNSKRNNAMWNARKLEDL